MTREGSTDLSVPSVSEPKMRPAFFNPRGSFVRDVSMVCYKAFAFASKHLTFADALSGTGARGVRVANEIECFSKVFLNDTNSKALEFGKESAYINHVLKKCVFSQSEACSFLSSRSENSGERFDFVDVDPFGTPADFVDCAIRGTKDRGLLSVTATDSAVLCGVYPRVASRKYLGFSLRTDYSHEVGMRLLFGLLALTAMRLETGIRPIFCHHDMHYFRAYCEVKVGNSHSRENEKEIGFILHCFRCGYRSVVRREEFLSSLKDKESFSSVLLECPHCKKEGKISKFSLGGPCWIGKIQSADHVERCGKTSDLPIFHIQELDVPLYYDLTFLSKALGTRTPRINDVIEKLKSTGLLASRTRLNPEAVRTDAEFDHLLSVVKELAL